MIEVLGFYKNVRGDRGLPHNLVLPFTGEKWVAWKKMKTSHISGNMQLIFFILSAYVWENNAVLNKKYTGMTLKSQIKIIVRVTFQNVAYISAILGPILTKFHHNNGITAA